MPGYIWQLRKDGSVHERWYRTLEAWEQAWRDLKADPQTLRLDGRCSHA